jgi:hypothetical protein
MKIGDVVMLKSGGQNMTVVKVLGDEVMCVYNNRIDGRIFNVTLPENAFSVIDVKEMIGKNPKYKFL